MPSTLSDRQAKISEAEKRGDKVEQLKDGSVKITDSKGEETLLPADAELLSTPAGREEYLEQAKALKWPIESGPNGEQVVITPWGPVTIPDEDKK